MLHHFCATLSPEINQKYCGINSFEVFPDANISQEKNTIYFYGPTLAAGNTMFLIEFCEISFTFYRLK